MLLALVTSLLTILATGAVARALAIVNNRHQIERDEVQARRTSEELRAQADERRAERLNEQRLALYVDLLAWANSMVTSAEPPAAELKARVALLGSEAVRKAFAEFIDNRQKVTSARKHLEDPKLGEQARKEWQDAAWATLCGPEDLTEACRAELAGRGEQASAE